MSRNCLKVLGIFDYFNKFIILVIFINPLNVCAEIISIGDLIILYGNKVIYLILKIALLIIAVVCCSFLINLNDNISSLHHTYFNFTYNAIVAGLDVSL